MTIGDVRERGNGVGGASGEIWPDDVIPAEGDRPALRLRTPEEGRAWLRKLAEGRVKPERPLRFSSLELLGRERDA